MPRSGATTVNQGDGSAVGDVRSSMLTLAQFQAQNGTNWVLADGSSAAGTKYNTVTGNANFPDLRGMVLRGKNNGRSDGNQNPDGDSALGTFQSHSNNSHNHGGATGAHTHTINNTNGAQFRLLNVSATGGVAGAPPSSFTTADPAGVLSNANATASISSDGGNEARMRNVTINHFIKAN